MAGTGGARPGAGRKRKADKYQADINKAEKKIIDKLPQIVEAQIDLALGLKAVRFNEETQKEEVYTTIPDRQAGQYLINRIMGTPTQRINITRPPKPLEQMTDEELDEFEASIINPTTA